MRSQAFRLVLTIGALGFVAWSAWTLRGRWRDNTFVVDPGTAALGVAVALPSALFIGIAWSLVIRSMTSAPPPLARVLSIHSLASLGKYAPGRMGQAVMRLAGLARFGYSARMIATSMGVELLSWITAGAFVAAALLWIGAKQPDALLGAYALPIATLCLGGVLVLAVVDRTTYPGFVRRVLGAEGRGPLLHWGMLLLHLGSWLLCTVHGILLSKAVGVVDLRTATYAATFFVLAPIAGFIALPMPAGVGVRESLTVLGLAPLVGASNALAAALLSRGASLIADVLLWLALSGRWARHSGGAPRDD